MLSIAFALAASAGMAGTVPDPAGFSIDRELVRYSVYARDSIHMPVNASGTANEGWFGSGGGLSLGVGGQFRLRAPVVVAGRSVSAGTDLGVSTTHLRVGGDLLVRERADFYGTVEVGGNLRILGSDVDFFGPVLMRGDLDVDGPRTRFLDTVHVGGQFLSGGGNVGFGSGARVRIDGPLTDYLEGSPPPGTMANSPLPSPLPRSLPAPIPTSRYPGYDMASLGLDRGAGPFQDVRVSNTTDTNIVRGGVWNCRGVLGAVTAATACRGDTLQPGIYGTLSFHNNSGVRMILTEGFYSFSDIVFTGSANRVILAQPGGGRTIIHSVGPITASGSNSFIGPAAAEFATGYGTDSGQFLGGTVLLVGGDDIQIPSDLRVWATISAPHGDVRFESQVTLFGQVFGERILGLNNLDFGLGAYVPFRPLVPQIHIHSPPDTAIAEANRILTLAVTLDHPNAYAVSFDWTTHSGLARAALDFDSAGGTVTFAPGVTVDSLRIPIRDDAVFEGPEDFRLVLSRALGGIFPDSAPQVEVRVTILDDEPAPRVVLGRVAAVEPQPPGALQAVQVPVRLTAPVQHPLYLILHTRDSTAVAPGDYDALIGDTILIPSLDTNLVVDLRVRGDDLFEGGAGAFEYLRLEGIARLVSSGSALDVQSGQVTIEDADTLPAIAITGGRVDEPDSGVASLVFVVNLSVPSQDSVRLRLQTRDGTARVMMNDYLPIDTVVVVRPGVREVARILVPILADHWANEGEESVLLVVVESSGARPAGDSVGAGFVVDTDPVPSLNIVGPLPVIEADTTIHFRLSLSSFSSTPVVVSWQTGDITARAGEDFVGVNLDSVRFEAGDTVRFLPVTVIDDSVWEPSPESLQVRILSVRQASPADSTAVAVILDDGDLPRLTLTEADTVIEGDTARFVGRLAFPAAQDVELFWSVNDDQARVADGDFTGPTSGRVTVPRGDTIARIDISTASDGVFESLERFGLRVSMPVPGLDPASDTSAWGWIAEGGPVPTLGFRRSDTAVVEDIAGIVTISVILSRPASHAMQVTLQGHRTSSTADSGQDWTIEPRAGAVLRFLPGQTRADVHVSVRPDRIDEPDETVDLRLIDPRGIGGPDPLAGNLDLRLTILDDDNAPVVRFARPSDTVPEDIGTARVVLLLDRPSSRPLRIVWSVDGTASSGGVDHSLKPGFLTIAPLDTMGIVNFAVTDDVLHELTEFVRLTIDTADGGVPGATAQIFILDNDGPPTIGFSDSSLAIPEAAGTIGPRVVLSHPSAFDLVVLLVPRSGSATLGGTSRSSDVHLLESDTIRITIPAGARWAEVPIGIAGDGRVEATEDFRLDLRAVDTLWIPGSGIRISIVDDDRIPDVQILTPPDGLRTGQARHTISWTVDGVRRPPTDTVLPEGWSLVVRTFTDTAGNQGSDTNRVYTDYTPPTVIITRPADRLLTNDPNVEVDWTVINGSDTSRFTGRQMLSEGIHEVVRCAEDEFGNRGCDTIAVEVDLTPPRVSILSPSDGDSLDDPKPPVSWLIEDRGRIETRSDTGSLRIGPGILVRCASDLAGNLGCDTVRIFLRPQRVIDAVYRDTDHDGKIDRVEVGLSRKWDQENLPLFDFTLGRPDAVPHESLRPSFPDPRDSSRLFFKIDPAWPFGATAFESADRGTYRASWTWTDPLTGEAGGMTVQDPFAVRDGVPPVILSASVRRTEDYQGQDTVLLILSEPVLAKAGAPWASVDDGFGRFHVIRAVGMEVRSDTVRLLVPPGFSGSVRPGLRVRLLEGLVDSLNNRSRSEDPFPARIVEGPPRPPLIEPDAPEGIVNVDPSRVPSPGAPAFVLMVSSRDTSDMRPYEPGQGYGPSSLLDRTCPQGAGCASTVLYVNRPARITLHAYDRLGTAVHSFDFELTPDDMRRIERDRLDRVRLEVRWNLRSARGTLVDEGIHLMRVVAVYRDEVGRGPISLRTNTVVKFGVRHRAAP